MTGSIHQQLLYSSWLLGLAGLRCWLTWTIRTAALHESFVFSHLSHLRFQ
jgi:hypothetical protein